MVLSAIRFASLVVVALSTTVSLACVCCAQGLVDELGDPLPENAMLRMGSLRFSSPKGVMELILSKDQKTLVSFGDLIIGWDAETGRELWRRSCPIGYLPACYGNRAAIVAPDGEHFLLADHTAGCITKWNMVNGKISETEIPCAVGPGAGMGAARSIDVSADGRLTFVGNGSGYQVFDTKNQVLYEYQEQFEPLPTNKDRLAFGGGFAHGRFSPDGSRIAIVTSKNPKKLQLLNGSNGETLGHLECEDNAVRMEFSPDGKLLAVTERDTAVRLYDCAELKRVWQCVFDVDKRSENYTSALTFSPDGAYLAICERNETIFKVEVATGKQVGSIRNHSWNPWAVIYTADGKRLVSSGWGGTIHQWDAESLEAIQLPKGFRGTDAITLSSDGAMCAGVDQAGQVRVVSRSNGTQIAKLNVPGSSFEVVEFSRDCSSIVAGGSWDGKVHVIEWELATSQIRNQWDWDVGNDPVTGVEDIVFSRDDKRIAVSVFRQDAAYLLDRSTKERIKMPHDDVYGASFSPNGDQIYSVGWDKKLRVWDGINGDLVSEKILSTSMKDSRMYTVCADPKGKFLTTCTLDASIGLYEVGSLELIREWDAGSSFVFGALRYSPDGLWLASGNASGELTVWDPTTGEQLHRFKAHDDHVYTIDFGRDNRTLCSGGSNVGYVWSLRPSKLNCDNVEDAMKKLCGDKGADAYHAWWYLLEQGDKAVVALKDLCDQVTKIYDIEAMVQKSSESQRARRRELLLRTTASNSDVISLTAATRIVSILSHIDTPAAQQVLVNLSERQDELGQTAGFELVRTRH